MENNILTEIFVAVRRSNRLLKRIVTIVVRNGLVDDTTRNISVKMLITTKRNHNTIEDNGYIYRTE